jgi:hypothetical protein
MPNAAPTIRVRDSDPSSPSYKRQFDTKLDEEVKAKLHAGRLMRVIWATGPPGDIYDGLIFEVIVSQAWQQELDEGLLVEISPGDPRHPDRRLSHA